jgi:hypothetical protein
MGVERFAKRIAEQPRKANKPGMPSPCGASGDPANLIGSIDQEKFDKTIYRDLYLPKKETGGVPTTARTMTSAPNAASAWRNSLPGSRP